jgi:four helix bundle protein
MHTPLRHEVLNQVVSVIEVVRPIVEAIGRRDRNLAAQVRDAMNSVGLNVAEGFGTGAGNSRLRFETARGSLYETQAGLRMATAWGYVTQEDAVPALEALDRLGGRIFGLTRR